MQVHYWNFLLQANLRRDKINLLILHEIIYFEMNLCMKALAITKNQILLVVVLLGGDFNLAIPNI